MTVFPTPIQDREKSFCQAGYSGAAPAGNGINLLERNPRLGYNMNNRGEVD